MRTLALCILSLAAAAPALAVDQGQCCASVGSVCISRCNKPGGCSGKGDCDLAFTSSGGTDLDPASPAFEAALRTLRQRDRARLRRLVAPSKPVPYEPRDPPEPPQPAPPSEPGLAGGTAQAGKIAAPGAGIGVPTLAQLGGTTAKVPMKHGSCGLDCGTHVLAVSSGNLDIPFQIGMSCPAGLNINYLAYDTEDGGLEKVVDGPTRKAALSQKLTLQPFSKQELEAACQAALGGSWPLPDTHHNTQKTVEKTIKESIKVWGRCSTWANTVLRTYPVALTLTCEDQSFVVPPG